VYRFSLASDDGSRLWIADQLVVSNDGPHSFKQESGEVALAIGFHAIRVEFFENWGGFDLKVMWTRPDGVREVISPDKLYGAP
jgi:hypothetical protein